MFESDHRHPRAKIHAQVNEIIDSRDTTPDRITTIIETFPSAKQLENQGCKLTEEQIAKLRAPRETRQ